MPRESCCGMTDPEEVATCVFKTSALSFFLTILLLALSLSRVDYDEYGFRKSRASGNIDRSEVYSSGLYFMGPDSVFVTYKATVHNLNMSDLSVWSRSLGEDAGTPLEIDMNVQYRLNPDNLEELYTKVGFEHIPFVRNVAVNTIKNNATLFSADEYLTKLPVIEAQFREALVESLREAAGVDLSNVAIRHVSFPESFYERKLAAGIQEQQNLIEEFKRTAELTRGNTSVAVKGIDNQAREVLEAANAESALIKQRASNKAREIAGLAVRQGLGILAESLNVTEQKHVLSLSYLFTLLDTDMKKYINFADLPAAKTLTL